VLLDLDGTLLDTVPFILASVRHAFEGRARRPTDAEWIAGIGTPLRAQLVPFTAGPADLEIVAARYRLHQRENLQQMTKAFPGAMEVVRALHEGGHPIAVVTGKIEEPARRSLDLCGLSPYVNVLVAADTCARPKPHPDPVLHALERLDRSAREAVFIGDSAIDVQTAHAAGVTSAGALWGACTREALLAAAPHHLLDDVSGIAALVARLVAEAA
jgi:pyrophosphatase PpaX